MDNIFYLQKQNVYAIPILHYKMEFAAQVKHAAEVLKPDCIAVELAETMENALIHAASRLPDISVVTAHSKTKQPIYYMIEPCDAAFEGLRCALEQQAVPHCIDLDVDDYPDIHELAPDSYAIQRIGLKNYYEAYKKARLESPVVQHRLDIDREMHMAKRLKELSLRYDRVLFVGGMAHVETILKLLDHDTFPTLTHAERSAVDIHSLTVSSAREVMAEYGWISTHYELAREDINLLPDDFPPDRQKLIYQLYRYAAEKYTETTGNPFPGYSLRNVMKFVRNYAFIYNRLMPDLYQILGAAKGCVDHNYAREVWEAATNYPYLCNVDGLPELNISAEELWGHSKLIRFHLKEKGRKDSMPRLRKDNSQVKLHPPGFFGICSYPPEDLVIERFGDFLKKKGQQIATEDAARTIPFSSSLEDGLDMRETIRHWTEKKLYVKAKGKPQGGVGSIVIIFDEDKPEEGKSFTEKYPWKVTWLGEHQQESDMSLYATSMLKNVIGPGISRCEYGGFMMSYPPRRMMDVWHDPDYQSCQTKSEVLLMAAIDYAVKPLIVYVAAKPPRSVLKSFAKRFGKKIIYIPLGQLSPLMLNKIRKFHVLDGHSKRDIADEYIV